MRQCSWSVSASDADRPNAAEPAGPISHIVRNVSLLFFCENKRVETGYARAMMRQVTRPLLYTAKGNALQCGTTQGVPRQVVDWCLAKMRCWARLAIAIVKAEFPDFIVAHSISIRSGARRLR